MLQGSPEWIEWKLKGIGASEVPAILGVCLYNTPHGVWLVKTGRSKGFEGNSFTQHGQETEAKARARYELINMDDMTPACAIHPEYEICRVSLDGIGSDKKLILEIKCPKGAQTLAEALAGRVPEHYWPQVQYQLAVTGAELCHFFVYHADTGKDALVEVKPDIKYQGEIIAKVLTFWDQHVRADIPPPLTDRDVKDCGHIPEIQFLCALLSERHKSESKAKVDKWKADVVALGGHPKVSCGRVQISTVNRNGKFSYHKLTVRDERIEA